MTPRNHLEQVHWKGVRSWLGGYYGGSYSEHRVDQVVDCDGLAVGIKYEKLHGTFLIGGGIVWHLVVSDGERVYVSENCLTQELPSVRSAVKSGDEVTVCIVERMSRIFTSESKFEIPLSEVRCELLKRYKAV